ncbi:MAG TPA: NUDIX domain-containing protein [Patescibacteria group bacterium]
MHTKQIRYTDESQKRDIKRLEKPAISVTLLIFSIHQNALQLILIKRLRDPFKNFWSIPGDIIYIDESLKDATRRVLFEKTGLKDVYLEQVHALGTVDRDPRGRVVTIAYLALLPFEKVDLTTAPNALHASWVNVKKLPELAFDHKRIVKLALDKIRKEIEYTDLAKNFLSKEFRLSDLQSIYEIVGNKKIDKRNFRKKLASLNLVVPTGKIYKEGSHRPAKLYRFRQ